MAESGRLLCITVGGQKLEESFFREEARGKNE
jgi:hypothetical protein